jgi:hypothetical protein
MGFIKKINKFAGMYSSTIGLNNFFILGTVNGGMGQGHVGSRGH